MSLPTPDPKALVRSAALTESIREEMANAGGTLSFSRFMALALYAENLGYYRTRSPFGPKGDFVTAPELSPLFAHCIAEVCREVGGDMLEYGAGSGIFARDLLCALAASDALPDHYWIIETSPLLRDAQRSLLEQSCPDLMSRIHWALAPPDEIRGIIFANEVLDALPVDCFQYQEDRFFERRVGWQDNHFVWQLQPASKPLAAQLALLPPLPEGYRSEIRRELPEFIQRMAKPLKQGLLLLVDYGYGQREYFHPARNEGTLTCFYRHHHHADPLILPGLQDITAHANFTAVAECATAAGLSLTGFTTQAAFLLGCGLPQLAQPACHDSAQSLWELAQVIKKLTLPDEMGEIIKFIGFSPDPDLTLAGFSLQDRRQDL